MTSPPANRRGRRHLRVGVEIRADSARVDRLWLVDQPAVQTSRLAGPILTRVDLAGRLALVQSFADPRVTRSTMRDDRGHHFSRTDSGTVFVSVPFAAPAELRDLRIRLADVSRLPSAGTNLRDLAELFDERPQDLGPILELSAEDLYVSPDWPELANRLGLPTAAYRFEIYQDDKRRFRWRFLRGAKVLADSAQGYPTRQACEADLRLVRENAPSAPITVLPLPD